MKVLNIAFQTGGKLVSASFELTEAAKSIGAEIVTAIMAEDAQPLAEELAARGGGQVLALSDAGFKFLMMSATPKCAPD